MKRRLLRVLDRAGLLGSAFRTYERLVSLRPGRPTSVDGPLLPPRRLMVRVAGTADADSFLRSGCAAYDAIAAHVALDELESVLDFGCGCGRVTRYWNDFGGAVSGSDVSAKAVAWCRTNLPFARFEVNRLAPPLAFADEQLVAHELCHVWQMQLHPVRMPLSYLLLGYAQNPYEAEARAVSCS